ncbi:MAG TPA: hypothetical protein VF604_12330 [Pyrinomonadaceae bacterium]
MKICPNCKKQYPDNVAVCPSDGTFLDLETPVAETQTSDSTEGVVPHTADAVDRIGTAAAETFGRDAGNYGVGAVETAGDRATTATDFSQTGDLADADYTENPMFGWLMPLIIVVILIVLGFMFCSKSSVPTARESGIQTNGRENKLI